MADDDREEAYDRLTDAVNVTKSELTKWLETDESKSVGMAPGGEKTTSTSGGESRARVGYR